MKFLIRLAIVVIVILIEDKIIYRRIRKIDKKERMKIDAEELKTLQEELKLLKEKEQKKNEHNS